MAGKQVLLPGFLGDDDGGVPPQKKAIVEPHLNGVTGHNKHVQS